MPETTGLPREVIKRDGRTAPFDKDRIVYAIGKAILATKGRDFLDSDQGKILLQTAVELVTSNISAKYSREQRPHVEEIQDIVENSLMKMDLYDVARGYVLYRKDREEIRTEKMRLLERDYVDEVDKTFSVSAIRLLVSRYLLRDENGKLIEGPKQMFQRVASLVVISDILHDPLIFEKKGGESIHPKIAVDFQFVASKLNNSSSNGIRWNKYHIERMDDLYEELNKKGQMKYSWEEFIDRLANGAFDSSRKNYSSYYNRMAEKKFLPNSPTLFNAGARLGQLSACFVIPIHDNIESIMKAATDCAVIFKSGGGVGINYSSLRPEGDVVASTGGVASGPVTFMRIIDTVTDVVKQGGKRRGANMGLLDITHPDIETFIKAKREPGHFENFNISVSITPEFWRSYDANAAWPLINPRDGKVWKNIGARSLFKEIASMAWNNADPGVVFLDNMNGHNPMKSHWGLIKSVNPCGEEPMYPFESCNLGSINVYQFVKREGETPFIDWDELAECIETSTRFLDNVIDLNLFPLEEIKKISKETRRIGLGLMGLADALYALRIPYNSEEGFALVSRLAEFFAFHSFRASVGLSRDRGAFPLFEDSSYKEGKLPFDAFYRKELWKEDWASISEEIKKDGIRNSHTLTIAPTGSISMIAEVSSGLEPQFALVFRKHVSVGDFYYTDQELEKELTANGFFNERVRKAISENGGSLQRLEDLLPPGTGRRLSSTFLVAYDIPWWDHVRAQFEMQKWISASVSKTINMPSWVTEEDVEKAYLFAYRLGLTGVTVYRDGSKDEQVLRTPSQRNEAYERSSGNETITIMRELGIEPPSKEEIRGKNEESKASRKVEEIQVGANLISDRSPVRTSSLHQIPKCPNCGGMNIVSQEGCRKCLDCGWSTCTVA